MPLDNPIILLVTALLGALLPYLVFKKYNFNPAHISVTFQGMALFISLLICVECWDNPITITFDWINLNSGKIDFGFYIDRISGLLLVIVCLISLLVQWFSIDYMKRDEGYKRYFSMLGLFTFSMIGIVISANLLVIFMFWELVGFSSYLLIGFWHNKESAVKAAKKAFIVNRIGDVGFVIALALSWYYFKSFDLLAIKETLYSSEFTYSTTALSVLGLSLFFGAIGKSAQFPLLVWLPDAMEGPTPVSALIHAATMVAAGVYLMVRVFFLLTPDVLLIVALLGSMTAFMGAAAALFQNDIKKVLAYSTISQLGYMMVGIGTGSYEAATFHLFTHAFFKAGLFLGAGSIIYSLHKSTNDTDFDAQDMRNMGGLKDKLPITCWTYLVFSLALVGVPLFSGFLSKEAILLSAYNLSMTEGGIFWLVTVLSFASIALTAFYVCRMFLMVFLGSYRGLNEDNVGEPSLMFKIVLIILAFGSISLVWSVNPIDVNASWIIEAITVTTNENHNLVVPIISILMILLGAGWAYKKYRSQPLQLDNGAVWNVTFNNWYLDKLYQNVIVMPIIKLSEIMVIIENKIIDRTVNLLGIGAVIISHIVAWIDRFFVDGAVNVTAYFAGKTGALTRSLQGGKIQTYILVAIIGLLIIIILAL